jgi:hypothetical protein
VPSSSVPPNGNGNGLPPVPVPPEQPPRWPEGALPRRAAQAEYVAAGGHWFAESYYRSLPLFIDQLSQELGSDIYEKMMLDDQVAGGVRTFVVSILSDPLTVRPWIDDDKDPDYENSKTYAEFCERTLGNLLHRMRRSVDAWLLEVVGGSVALGNRVTEKVAALEESGQDAGRLVWDRLKVKPRNRTAFVLDPYNNLLGLLAVTPGRYGLAAGSILTPDMLQDSNLLPPEKFAILSWEPKEEDPRGTSLLRTVYEAWWEKLQVARDWLKHLAQFGSPSLWGTTAPDALDEPRVDEDGNPLPGATISPEQKLVNELLKFRNGYALALPNGSTLNVLQTANAGDGFLKKIEHCERRIDRAILLAARTRMEAKHGSKADAEASQDVTSQAVRQGKNWGAEMVTRDLIYPLVRWNFGPDAAKRLCPYATLSPVEKKDWADTANAVSPMVASGFLKPSQFPALYAQLGLPPAEEPLTDDQQQTDEDSPAGGGAPAPAPVTAEAPFAAGEYEEHLHPRGYGGKWAPKGGDHGHEQHTEQLTWRGKVAGLLRQALSQPGKSVAKVLAAAEALHAAYREGGFRAVPKVAVVAAYRKAKASFTKLETRYGRKAAIAMAGAYLSCYAAYAANPVLMLYLPSPTAAILGTAEALRALGKGARKLAGKKEGTATFGRENQDPDAMLGDLEDFIRSVSDAAGEEAPKFRRSDLAEHLSSFLDQVEDGDAEFAFGLPTPYEEGKHPRGYAGKWVDKPGGRESAKEFTKRVNKHVEERPDIPLFHNPARLRVEKAILKVLAPLAGKHGEVSLTFDPRYKSTSIWLGDRLLGSVSLQNGKVLVQDPNVDRPKRAVFDTASMPGPEETEYRIQKALGLKVSAESQQQYGRAHQEAEGQQRREEKAAAAAHQADEHLDGFEELVHDALPALHDDNHRLALVDLAQQAVDEDREPGERLRALREFRTEIKGLSAVDVEGVTAAEWEHAKGLLLAPAERAEKVLAHALEGKPKKKDANFSFQEAYLAPGGQTLFVPGSAGTAAFDEVALDSDEALPWLEHYHRQGQHPPEWPAAAGNVLGRPVHA